MPCVVLVLARHADWRFGTSKSVIFRAIGDWRTGDGMSDKPHRTFFNECHLAITAAVETAIIQSSTNIRSTPGNLSVPVADATKLTSLVDLLASFTYGELSIGKGNIDLVF
jgi:hypothetical protein